MLEKIDLSIALDKKTYRERFHLLGPPADTFTTGQLGSRNTCHYHLRRVGCIRQRHLHQLSGSTDGSAWFPHPSHPGGLKR